ncbi:hypothetical protein M404DRAFT_26555 [Pisolithus tinctorius Marx 270]|uniref:Retrotransposon gag domain-containing protein n=1 Tax=Pisolithus tinctorius Marx 270 TaxID=870435 RepID=A0A0C3P8B6_PISTI|nr:hypothetical protein M404DRAFT_26555 [Pisolithus tinctorius Marx 270]
MSSSSSKGMTALMAVKPTELKIGAPSDFDGDQKNTMSWLYSVQTYLLVNKEIYDSDTKKVVYALLYMKKGVAHSWAATFQKTSLEKTPPSFGTFANFTKTFKESFTSADTTGTAIAKLHTLKQKDSVEQYITDFQTTAADSTITEDIALIKFFSQGQTFHYKGKTPQKKVKKIHKIVEVKESDEEEKVAGPSIALNTDGTQNSKGKILFSATLYFKIKGLVHQSFFHVINCGTENVILSLPWLQENNPVVDWRMGTLSIDEKTDRSKELRCNISSVAVKEPTINLVSPVEKKGINKFMDYEEPEDETICAHFITTATELAQEEHKKKLKAVLPEDYKDFTLVFEKPSDGVLPP